MYHNCQLHTRLRVSHVCECVCVWDIGFFIASRVGQLNLTLTLSLALDWAGLGRLTLFAPPSLIVKCMQTVGEYCCHRCCCCRDWCCSGCRYFCASDGNTFINFTAGHWQRQQAPPVASCQLPVALSLRSSIFSPVLRADCPFLFLFPTALLLLQI